MCSHQICTNLLGVFAPDLYEPLAIAQNKEAEEDFKGEYTSDESGAENVKDPEADNAKDLKASEVL